MAVLVTKNSGSFHEPGNWYYSYAYNLGYYDSVSTGRVTIATTGWSSAINVGFVSESNCAGVVMGIEQLNCDRNVRVGLFERQTVTLTLASPGKVNLTDHGLLAGQEVWFATTGALPTGITSPTKYFVKNPGLNDFEVAASVGGTSINFTGTQSGTQYVNILRTSKTLTSLELQCGKTTSTWKDYGSYYHDFEFSSPYPVDTTASKWYIGYITEGGTKGNNYMFRTGNNSYNVMATYSDTTASFTNGDAVVIRHPIEITGSATIDVQSHPVGETNYGSSGLICSNRIDNSPTGSFMRFTAPSGSYTFTIKGHILAEGHAGIQIGTEANPIPIANKITLSMMGASFGNSNGILYTNRGSTATFASTYQPSMGRASFLAYGEYKVNNCELVADVNLSTTSLEVDADMSSEWSVGDTIAIGKNDVVGQGNTNTYIIKGFGKKDVTQIMTANNAPAPYIVAASSTYSTYSPYKAFDGSGNDANRWAVATTTNSWLSYDFGNGNGKTVTMYWISCALNATTRAQAPKNWTFEGSNNNVDWTVLDTQTNQTNWDDWNFYSFANVTAYRYYRINITSNNGGATYTTICEMHFLEDASNYHIYFQNSLASYKRLTGGKVINLTCYGVALKSETGALRYPTALSSPTAIRLQGVEFFNSYLSTYLYGYIEDEPTNLEEHFVKNFSCYGDIGAGSATSTIRLGVPRLNTTIQDGVFFRATGIYLLDANTVIVNNYHKSGYSRQINIIDISSGLPYRGCAIAYGKLYIDNYVIQNGTTSANYFPFLLNGRNCYINNFSIYGHGIATHTVALQAGIAFSTFLKSNLSNITIERIVRGINFFNTSIIEDVVIDGITFSNNTTDIYLESGGYPRVTLKNTSGLTTIDRTYQQELTDGSRVAFVNYNSTASDDRVITPYGDFQRCATGLPDNTYHNNILNYSTRRFEVNNSDSTTPLLWDFSIPTGNIQGKQLGVEIWCKISSSLYYGGTSYIMPQMCIDYDDGLAQSCVSASQTTDWQLLSTAITPASQSSKIYVSIKTSTDATGSDCYVYFGEMKVTYPMGYGLDLGSNYIYSDAAPVDPPLTIPKRIDIAMTDTGKPLIKLSDDVFKEL